MSMSNSLALGSNKEARMYHHINWTSYALQSSQTRDFQSLGNGIRVIATAIRMDWISSSAIYLLTGRRTNPKAQAPPVNLKERIAALQQRNVSPSNNSRPTSPSFGSQVPTPTSAGLRDKIARFERKGGVPVPRGSFGLGAPPLAENAPAKRRGELYGNRIPGAVRASGGGPPISRSGSPFDSSRSVSLSALDAADIEGEDLSPTDVALPLSPSSPFLGLSAEHVAAKAPMPRGTDFATALDLARKAEGVMEAVGRESSPPSPVVQSSLSTVTHEDQTNGVQADFPPAIVVSSDDKPSVVASEPAPLETVKEQKQDASLTLETLVLQEPASSQPAVETGFDSPGTLPTTSTPGHDEATLASKHQDISPLPTPNPTAASSDTPTIVESPTTIIEHNTPTASAPVVEAASTVGNVDAKSDDVRPITQPTQQPPTAAPVPPSSGVNEEPKPQTPAVVSEAQSPVGPFSLANAVFDLGKVVANIQDMFPGQISPIATPPPYRPLRMDPPVVQQEPARKPLTSGLKAKKSFPDLKLPLDNTGASVLEEDDEKVTVAQTAPIRQQQKSNVTAPKPTVKTASLTEETSEQFVFLNAPRSSNARPMSMIETSPGHLAVAHRITPITGRAVPMFLPGGGAKDFDHFPPTPENGETDFGTVSLHKASHSFSHTRSQTSIEQGSSGTTKVSTFSAVVHRKVTELPSTSSKSSLPAIYSKPPETPQTSRTKRSEIGEVPQSPGYGELAALLHEAALLEFSLEQGELPSEATRKEEADKRQKEKEAQEAASRAAKVAAAEEDKQKIEAAAAAKARTEQQQQQTESKSRSSFRMPMTRNKSSSHRRDTSTDSQTRSKSVLLPFRPTPGDTRQQTQTPTISERHSTPSITTAADTDASSQTSPKSPKQYFAGLRRLASTSRTSIQSGVHPRYSVSTSSEMSSEDSASIPTPPGALESGGSRSGSTTELGHWNGSGGIGWPSLSPKKSPGSLHRAATFADKMWNRGRTKSTVSTSSAYETIDRITKSAAAKSAAALIPPLDPISFTLQVPLEDETDLPSPPEELVSPRRSASLYVASTSQFPPVYSARPTSSVYTPLPSVSAKQYGQPQEPPSSIESVFAEKLVSPKFNERPAGAKDPLAIESLFSAKPTSPVYTPHHTSSNFRLDPAPTEAYTHPHHLSTRGAMKSEETITIVESPLAESLLPSPTPNGARPESWMSEDSSFSSISSIPSPIFDSFPSVPSPPPATGRYEKSSRPSLPLTPSFFEPAPLSSTAVGTEFLPAPSPFVRSATVGHMRSNEHRR
ncbi:hypothetical protein Hypma_010704 [Hypsizygus marmoreus]|uniref:Uncharacterized protein n=1 Tax=Hypsizygus marmoreus TaxID=39966 RepID=A0A369JS81_HYPMA|nr:hypothetical protein Hypma_010704 [Hypsizygus marmoreus]